MILKHRHLSILWSVIFTILIIGYSYFYAQEYSKQDYLRVVFLDVGQGDSVYIEAPNGRQVLIDGGPDARVVNQLAGVMPLFDKSIDLVVATHADADHIGGLSAVFDNYSVSRILENGVVGKTKTYQKLEQKILDQKIKKEIAQRGDRIVIDEEKNIYIDIFFPQPDVSGMDSNSGSIVGKLSYGDKSFMLTGDATTYTENLILKKEDTGTLKSDVLKLGHHGSNTSSSLDWIQTISPSYAIISAGLDNKYGHPHREVLDKLDMLKISYISTYKEGNIEFNTDGLNLWKK